MKTLSLAVAITAVVLGGLYFAVMMSPRTEAAGGWHFQEAGQIPVLHRGRDKPLDTLARTSLTILNHRDSYKDAEGNRQPAVRWLLDVMTADQSQEPRPSEKVRAFRIEHEQLRQLLALKPSADSLYAFADFSGKAKDLLQEANRARKVPERDRTEHDIQVLELAAQVALYMQYSDFETPHKIFRIENDQVLNLVGLQRREGLRYGFSEFAPRIGLLLKEDRRARQVPAKEQSVYDVKVIELFKHVELYRDLAQREGDSLKMVPPAKADGEWQTLHEGIQEMQAGGHNPQAMGIVTVLREYSGGKPEAFNREVAKYLKLVNGRLPEVASTARFEMFFNEFDPFYHCSILYVAVLVLALVSLFPGLRSLGWGALGLGIVVLVAHSWAIGARMTIQGRPPVTNLYSSAVFIGWGCVLLCQIMAVVLYVAFKFPPGLACGVGAALGFPTLLIAHFLSLGGDTLEMMQAVLDTNFWLATHVTCVTLGYVATLVAGAFGLVLLIVIALEPVAGQPVVKLVGKMTYGVVCFATLLSFTGTVLGGLWADVSWGRFWGWDPKENGALLIVIWNALILHARWGGMVKERGLAVLTLVGNMVTAWSWFGTNQLGVGLHAYGFNNSLALGCRYFWLGNIFLIGMGLIPVRFWHSFLAKPPVSLPDASPKAPRKQTSRSTGDGQIGLNPTT